jgi:CO/xanthine dehydrogenase Mo-binding subunit
VQLDEGRVRNASFTDYLIPTAMDMPRVRSVILEHPDPDAAYGVKGAGEPPTISSGAAVVAAVEQAIGHPLPQVPVRPEHIVAARLATAGDRLTR